MEPRSIPLGSKPKRRHQPTSERHERRFQSPKSWISVRGFSKKRHRGPKKLEEETAFTSQKRRQQERWERERQKLWLLWEDRSTSSRPKLPSIRKIVFKVWEVQSLCIMLQNQYPKPRETWRDQERANQENNRDWGDKQWLRCRLYNYTFRRQHNTYTEWRR